jgi:ubiquinone/menaquinone biosynthesis C-methylase UbiE
MVDVASYYDKRADNYDETFGTLYFRVYDAVTWKYLEPYVPTNPDGVILDAGGGTGRWAIRMAAKGCRVVLMDNSEGMLRVAEKKVKENNLQHKIAVKKGNIAETGYPDETFNMVLCEHALFLFANPDAVIVELKRVLKKNAPLIISAQNRYVQSLSMISNKPSAEGVGEAFRVLASDEHGHMAKEGKVEIYTWTPSEFRGLLKRNGLRVEKMVGKCVTMPLRIKEEIYSKKKFPEDLLNSILQFELALCEKQDVLALAGHLQAIVFKH